MFTIDPTITDLQMKEKKLFKVLFSINTHDVATPEMSHERASSYAMFARDAHNGLSAYVGLHLLQTDRKFFYVHSSNPFAERELFAVEDEARGFVEELGALLDEIDLAAMSAADRDRWLNNQSIFMQKQKQEPGPTLEPEAVAVPATPETTLRETAAQALPAPSVPLPPELSAPVQADPPAQSAPPPAAAPAAMSSPQPMPGAEPAPAAAKPEPDLHAGRAGSVKDVVPSPDPDQAPVAPKTELHADTVRKLKDLVQSEIRASLAKHEKQPKNKGLSSSTGVVSRDKEALARLFTSF